MIKREDLVPGAKFRQTDGVTDVEILCVGAKEVFLRHTNGVENLWHVDLCLAGLKKIPPPKEEGIVYITVWTWEGSEEVYFTSSLKKFYDVEGIKTLAKLKIPWKEGQGIE